MSIFVFLYAEAILCSPLVMAAVQVLLQMGTINLLFIWIPNFSILQENSYTSFLSMDFQVCVVGLLFVWLNGISITQVDLRPLCQISQGQISDCSCKHCQPGKLWRYMGFPINCWGSKLFVWSFSFLWNIDRACRMWCDCSECELDFSDLDRKNLCSAHFFCEGTVWQIHFADSFALIFAICFKLNPQIIKNTGKTYHVNCCLASYICSLRTLDGSK